ncbi:hypothetical protein QR680_011067 [Steinernema hermaphroditum]|uniref:Uncharacterized protein n=1 Tax=Steinernema hermaphroditum TaxID=289476 RepID=A0AA39ITI2_9BILA|nr:hypothetical protein QR680_011067 [Steinernema hermaphroditum]
MPSSSQRSIFHAQWQSNERFEQGRVQECVEKTIWTKEQSFAAGADVSGPIDQILSFFSRVLGLDKKKENEEEEAKKKENEKKEAESVPMLDVDSSKEALEFRSIQNNVGCCTPTVKMLK